MDELATGLLAYGYDLGGPELGWEVHQVDTYGALVLDWYTPESDDIADFHRRAEQRLRAVVAGFTEQYVFGVSGYFARERAANARVGVKLQTHGPHTAAKLLLATRTVREGCGAADEPHLAALATEPAVHGWDATLSTALAALGLTPNQARPRWLLRSTYD